MAPPTYPKTPYNPPETLVRTSHSMTIKANGVTLGLIQGWNPQQGRQITPIYEINQESSGLVLENVPGNIQNLTISIQRFDLWTKRMEEAFGSRDLLMLSNQSSGFSVQEVWQSPSGLQEAYEYTGCWFESLGRNFSSTDNRIVNVNATLRYVHKYKVA